MTSRSGARGLCFSIISGFTLLGIFAGDVFPVAATQFDTGTLSLSSMKLLGDAHFSDGSFILTRELDVPYSGAGGVLYSKPIIFRLPESPYPASFSTFFSFSIKNLNPFSIGGGLAFVISPDSDYVGDAGGYLGIKDANGGPRNGVVAVEFDTQMDVEFNDVNGNHVGLDLNSVSSARVRDLDSVGIDLKSGNLINSWIDYSGSSRTIEVYVSYSNLKPKEPILSTICDLNRYILNDSAFVGFAGSTQGSTETHSIEWWSFSSSLDDESPPYNSPLPSASPRQSLSPPSASLTNPAGNAVHAPPPSITAVVYSPKTTSHGNSHSEISKNTPGAIAGVVTAGAFFLAFFAVASIWMYNKKFKSEKESDNLAMDVIKLPKQFSYKDLHVATKGFQSGRVIGHGAFGTVYRGVLPSTGDVVAVKRCAHNQEGKAEFLSELSIIGTLRHRNLVRLQGWCHEKGENLLVYDLMANGSLDKVLFESRMVLPWPHRWNILLGVASALAYLHQECERQVIHRDVKTSNIMLDEGFNARLGDFGLAREVEHNKSPDATVAAGTMGYLAPEYLITGQATDKTDVYSYGAVVLEVATGRRPIEKEVTGGNLVEWVWSLHGEGRLTVAADSRLRNEFDEGEMRRLLLVGLTCTQPDPMIRPMMRGVVQMLAGEAEVPSVPRTRPTLSFSTAELIMTLQDGVPDSNGMVTMSLSVSSEEDRLPPPPPPPPPIRCNE